MLQCTARSSPQAAKRELSVPLLHYCGPALVKQCIVTRPKQYTRVTHVLMTTCRSVSSQCLRHQCGLASSCSPRLAILYQKYTGLTASCMQTHMSRHDISVSGMCCYEPLVVMSTGWAKCRGGLLRLALRIKPCSKRRTRAGSAAGNKGGQRAASGSLIMSCRQHSMRVVHRLCAAAWCFSCDEPVLPCLCILRNTSYAGTSAQRSNSDCGKGAAETTALCCRHQTVTSEPEGQTETSGWQLVLM